MKRATYRNVLAGLIVALAIGAGLSSMLLGAGLHGQQAASMEQEAVINGAAVTEVVNAATESGSDVQVVIDDLRSRLSAVQNIRVVDIKKRQLVASTISSEVSDGTLPRKLQRNEKSWYDEGRELRAALKTNIEEGKARKHEILASVDSAGALVLVFPLEYSGKVNGTVMVVVAGSLPAAEIDFFLLLWVSLLVVVAFAAVGYRLSAPRNKVFFALALVLSVFVFVQDTGFKKLDQGRLEAESHVAVAGQRILLEMDQRGPDSSWLHWDQNVFRQPRAMHSNDGAVMVQAVQASAEISRGRFLQGVLGLFVLSLALGSWVALGWAVRTYGALINHNSAYAFVLPAMIGMLLLVFFPFGYGVLLSFTNQTILNLDKPLYEVWAGLDNFVSILSDFDLVQSSDTGTSINYNNFYWTLGFTIVWTVTNVTFGVTMGLFLALLLNTPGLKMRPVYRVLLILPWAVPNYITALIWRGMFHQQFGVINQVVQIFGHEPIAWFDQPLTSFLAVLATNGWLSFPFMMVVSLGALQSIPADLYEAARVDGASKWQQFKMVTLPMLKPALVPAVILSVVWTFNMFNIIYLVSAGNPAGATEILITDAYKIAFEQYRYGYAAAYSVVIFMILLLYGVWQNRVTQATEGV